MSFPFSKKQPLVPWAKRDYKPVNQSIKHVSNELLDFADFLRASPKEEQCRKEVFGRCRSWILSCFPDADVALYGSTATCLALPLSDIDISIVSGYDDECPWFKLSPVLEEHGAKHLQIISSSRVPVIKFVDPVHGFSVDVTFGTAVKTAVAQIQEWGLSMERLNPLVLVVKYLLWQYGLHLPYTGGLGSFSVVLMVRHYLLSLQFQSKGPKMTPESPMGPLLLGFLRYFGRFNYHALAILVDGTTVPKSSTGLLDPKQPFNMVLVNPLVETAVNCASSSFRMAEVAAMFLVVEKQLRQAVNLDLSDKSAPFPTALSSVVYVDPGMVEWRKKVMMSGVKKKKAVRNPETGKSARKMFKMDENFENAHANSVK